MVAQLVPDQHPILGCAEQLRAVLVEVAHLQAMYMTPAEQKAAVVELERAAAALAGLQLRVVAAAEDAANRSGARDVGAWLASITRADFPAGRAQARLAESLDRRWTRVAAAMAHGEVSLAQARVVVEALEQLPADLDRDLVGDAETRLVAWCGQFRPSELRRLGRRILEVIAPEIAEAEEAKRLEEEEQRAREQTSLRTRRLGNGTSRTTILHPDADQDRLLTYLHAFASPRRDPDTFSGEEDRIPHHRRLGQAFGALLEHLDPARLPHHGGDTTTLMVTITLDSLRAELGTGTVLGGEPLSATAIRRLACTANIIPAVLGGTGEILDLGRTRRLSTPAQRKALRLRDHHCRAENCTIPATWCEAHHRQPWTHGGNTDLTNALLLCNWHHHRAHDPRFTTHALPNGNLRFHRRN